VIVAYKNLAGHISTCTVDKKVTRRNRNYRTKQTSVVMEKDTDFMNMKNI